MKTIQKPYKKESFMPEAYNEELVELFKTRAKDVSAVIHEADSIEKAIPYLIDICEKKLPCELLSEEPGTKTGPLGPNGVPTRVQRIIAAPDLDEACFAMLHAAAEEKGFLCIREGLRNYLAGIDIGIAQAILGVAPSASCMVNTGSEDVRLAGMVAEISVLFLKKSAICPDLPSAAQPLRELQKDGGVSYTTFITGPSRTADIERVGAIGVHGPLELHVILLES